MRFIPRFFPGRLAWCGAGACLALSLARVTHAQRPGELTALDRYVAAPDTNYSFEVLSTNRGEGYSTYVFAMTSQSWRSTNEVDRTLWKHWMTLVRPDDAQSSKSLLLIGGGGNNRSAPQAADAKLALIALATKSVVTELRMVPNQPLTFAGETKGRSEDSFIAYTWDKFLRTGDELWPARLPMTKSAVRAMDTVQTFCAGAAGGRLKIDGFFVAGASKRGWTTWSTAAVDKRVIAIAPIVIDMLNIVPSFKHHWEAYGFYAPAVQDYEAMGLMEWDATREYAALMKIEEPYGYRERLTMPKFIINSSGDQFFLPDSAQFYFKDLPGVKYLRYVPNTDHGLKNSDAWQSLLACYAAVLDRSHLPEFSWDLEKDGTLRVATKDKPRAVKLWRASNPEKRDFRLGTIGPVWEGSEMSGDGPVYTAKITVPEKGWTAFFAELTYPSSRAEAPFKFTTQVYVVPDVTPHQFAPRPASKPEGFLHKNGAKTGG